MIFIILPFIKYKNISFQVPDKTSLESLVESSNCDIRACINALQFSCIQNTSDFSSIFQSDETPSTSKKSKKVSGKKSAKSQSSVGAKDQSLILFHALGKILYAKRDTVPEKEPLPPHLGNKLKFEDKNVLKTFFLLYLLLKNLKKKNYILRFFTFFVVKYLLIHTEFVIILTF